MENKNGSFLGLLPLLSFLGLYFAMGIGTGDFNNLPILVGILAASGIALVMKKPGAGKKSAFEERVTLYCKGGGKHTVILMVIIFILAGAFYQVAYAMHAVDSVTSLGLGILPSRMILPGLFLIGCILSFSMGTSMGTVSALIPVATDIAAKTGVSAALTAGAVVSGAMFGDNISFISDTTIAATRTQNIAMKEKFKTNIRMVLPAVLVNCVLLALQPVDAAKIMGGGSFDFVNLIPYIAVILCSLTGVHVIPSMAAGIVSGVAVGVWHGDFGLVESFSVIHEGMRGMEDMAVIAVLVGGLSAMMNELGGIDWLLDKLTRRTKTTRGAELGIAGLVSLIDIFTTNNTISILTAGPIAKDISEKFEVAPQRTASILDIFSSAFNGLLPYGAQLLAAGGIAGISPVSVMLYNWYSMLMIVFGILFILLGWPRFKKRER